MRVLIADDHSLFRDGLRSLLESRGVEITGEARNGAEAVELAQSQDPDIVLMDLSMPEMTGLEAIRRLANEMPDLKIVVLTASEEDDDLFEALKAGALGYLLKNLDADEFFQLLQGAERGEPALTPAMAKKMLEEFARRGRPGNAENPRDPCSLTERELEILGLMVRGTTSNLELGRELQVSKNTIKFHVRNILEKLRLHSRAQAVSYAIRHRLVDPGG
jgi:DNA-binding NarL/FixJ family response regulator